MINHELGEIVIKEPVKSSNKMLCCGQRPIEERTAFMSLRMSFPLTIAVPDDGEIIPVSIDIVVVLPAPVNSLNEHFECDKV